MATFIYGLGECLRVICCPEIHFCVQSRALLTYIRRIYHPFLLHDPAIPKDSPILCAYWAHTQPLLAGMPQAQNSVSMAIVIPALAALPAALQEMSKHLGTALCRSLS